MSMRAFVALEVTDEKVLDSLQAMQRLLSSSGDLKVVERENLHFTLKFLGEVKESEVAKADANLRALALAGAVVELRGVGAFPSARNPSVVWVGVSPATEEPVANIAREVLRALDGVGEKDDRPFRAHLTLARVRARHGLQALTSLINSNSDASFGTVRLKAMKLKSSRLTPSGPVYADLGAYALS